MFEYGINFQNGNIDPDQVNKALETFLTDRGKGNFGGKTEIIVTFDSEGFVTISFKTYPKEEITIFESRQKAAELIVELSKYLPPAIGDVEVFIEDADGRRSLSFPVKESHV